MARIRTIKPEFWRHEGLSALPESTHMLAAALLTYADDFGYFNANPKLIQAECFPLREPLVSIQESLTHLAVEGYIRLGDGPNGRRYGHIVEFSKHQRVAHPTESKIKCLPITWLDGSNPPENFVSLPETFRPEQGTGNREQGNGKEQGKDSAAGAAQVLPPELIPDPRKAIFDDGLRWLAAETRRPERSLRPMVGKWIKARGDPETAAALIAAQQARPVDPIAWIEARLKANEQRRPSDLQRRRSLAEAFLSVGAGGDDGDQTIAGEVIAGVPDGPGG